MLAAMLVNQEGPPLIVCPLSLLSVWEEHLKNYALSLSVHVFHGPRSTCIFVLGFRTRIGIMTPVQVIHDEAEATCGSNHELVVLASPSWKQEVGVGILRPRLAVEEAWLSIETYTDLMLYIAMTIRRPTPECLQLLHMSVWSFICEPGDYASHVLERALSSSTEIGRGSDQGFQDDGLGSENDTPREEPSLIHRDPNILVAEWQPHEIWQPKAR